MNKRVIQALIVLLWSFLAIFAILKLFFAEQFIAVIDNEKIIHIGKFIDSRLTVKISANTVLGLLGTHFYFCSCKQIWKLPASYYLYFAVYALLLNTLYEYASIVASIIELVGFLLIPLLLKANMKQTAVVFIVHQLGQLLILFIRSEPIYLYETNYATRFLLLFDAYIWLVLCYLYSNLYKEKTLWEWLAFPFSEIKRKRNLKRNLRK